MTHILALTAALGLASTALAQCGAGSPAAVVDGESGSYTANVGSSEVYAGSNYFEAIQTAVDSISSGERVSVLASGSIGAASISISSGKTFEGCGTIDVGFRTAHGGIEVLDASDVSIPYLTMTGTCLDLTSREPDELKD